MWRIIIILILLIILFYMVRRAIREVSGSQDNQALPGKDVMVQDPVCKMYVTAGSAVLATIGGQNYYFCSEDCARTFKKQLSTS